MIRIRKNVVALGTLTAAVALLCGMPEASAQTAPGAGSFPGSFLVPGTNTSLKIGGFVKLDVTYDIGPIQQTGGVSSANLALPNTFPHTQTHGFQVFAGESRFSFETRTPSAYGEIKTFIDADFQNPSGVTNAAALRVGTNSFGLRLRNAYATIGPWLVGQFSSNLTDPVIQAEALDTQGPVGLGGVKRVPQVRYTYLIPGGQSIGVGIESSEASITTQTGGTVTNTTLLTQVAGSNGVAKIPDPSIAYTIDQPWGRARIGATLRNITLQNGAGFKRELWGYTVTAGARIPIFGKDAFITQVIYGLGNSRDSDNSIGQDALVNFTTGRARLLPTVGGMVGYMHYWTDTLRSSATMSYVRSFASNEVVIIDALNKYTTWGTVNLIWSPVPQVDTGIELIYDSRKIYKAANLNNTFAEAYRLQFSTKVKF